MVTNKTIYGATALVYIAVHSNGKYIGLSEIAEKHQIPLRFLEQVFSRLKGNRLVNASRGAGGGYSLARTAERISLADIICACEGLADLCLDKNQEENSHSDNPVASNLLRYVNRGLKQLQRNLDSTSLRDLIQAAGVSAEMYWI
jgi:Rrf2 family iron-sulfur cluster assembly transcriptional regulator